MSMHRTSIFMCCSCVMLAGHLLTDKSCVRCWMRLALLLLQCTCVCRKEGG
jgi:hypothetical protein